MTHESQYQITGRKEEWFTLYEARKALLNMATHGKLMDSTAITRSGRSVAYFSEWTETVRPMFGAHEQERHVLFSWENPQARPL